jgi:hypothetical protein
VFLTFKWLKIVLPFTFLLLHTAHRCFMTRRFEDLEPPLAPLLCGAAVRQPLERASYSRTELALYNRARHSALADNTDATAEE